MRTVCAAPAIMLLFVSLLASTADAVTVTGRVVYENPIGSGTWEPVPNAKVRVRENDPWSPDDNVFQPVTSASGSFYAVGTPNDWGWGDELELFIDQIDLVNTGPDEQHDYVDFDVFSPRGRIVVCCNEVADFGDIRIQPWENLEVVKVHADVHDIIYDLQASCSPKIIVPSASTHCSGNNVYLFGLLPSREEIARVLGQCCASDNLTGSPCPPGSTLFDVTDEGCAWDEGLLGFLLGTMGPEYVGGIDLETGVTVPENPADAVRIGANVGAALCDLWDRPPADQDYDDYDGLMAQMWSVLESGNVQSMPSFWSAWKAMGLPQHYPLIVLFENGFNYNTLPTWNPDIGGLYSKSPGQQFALSLNGHVTDPETPWSLLQLSLAEVSGPLGSSAWLSSSGTVYADMQTEDGEGLISFKVAAFDGVGTRLSPLIRVYWADVGPKNPPQELDDCSKPPCDGPEGDEAPVQVVSPGPNEVVLVIPADGARAQLSVFDVAGRKIRSLFDGPLHQGSHSFRWDGISDAGASVSSGVYFVRAIVDGQVTSRKMLMKR